MTVCGRNSILHFLLLMKICNTRHDADSFSCCHGDVVDKRTTAEVTTICTSDVEDMAVTCTRGDVDQAIICTRGDVNLAIICTRGDVKEIETLRNFCLSTVRTCSIFDMNITKKYDQLFKSHRTNSSEHSKIDDERETGKTCVAVMLPVTVLVILICLASDKYKFNTRKRSFHNDRLSSLEIFCEKLKNYSDWYQICVRRFCIHVFDPGKRFTVEDGNIQSRLTRWPLSCFETCEKVFAFAQEPYKQTVYCTDPGNSIDTESIEETLLFLCGVQAKYVPFQTLFVYPLIDSVNSYLDRVRQERLPQDEEMCYEVRRFQSYNSVPVRASPMRLAQSGFYATGSGDETRCYSCRMTYRDWRLMDQPDQIHRSMSPDCPHLNNTDQRNIPVSSSASDSDVTTVRGVIGEYPITNGSSENVTYQPEAASTSVSETSATSSTSTETPALAGLDISKAVYPQYRDVSSRLDSYQGWGWSHVQDPQVLARAGFYYAGYRDCVRCFFCGVGLRTWEREDDPWVEHVRWRSSCDYVRLMRGEQFAIQALANGPSNLPPLSHQPVASQTLSSLTAVSCDGPDVDARTRAIEMGFQEEVVDRALSELTGSQRVPGQRDVILLETLLEKLMMVTTVPTTTQTSSVPNQINIPDSPMSEEPISLQSASVNRLSSMESHTAASSKVTSLVGSVADDSIPASETNQKTVRDGPDRNSHDCRNTSNYDQEKRHDQDGNDTEESGDQEVTDRLSTSQERQLEEENQSLRDESTCKICLDNPSCIVFLPCGHLVTCAECAPALRKCPICRALIRGTVRAHTVTNDNVSN